MAKKIKGIPYFPVDSEVSDVEELMEAKFGIEGIGAWFFLQKKIASTGGYFCLFDEDIQYLFAYKHHVDANKLSEMLQFLFGRKVLSREMYDKYKILTSEELQRTYKVATRKRKEATIDPRYNLIVLEEESKSEENEPEYEQCRMQDEPADQTIPNNKNTTEQQTPGTPTDAEVIEYADNIGAVACVDSFLDTMRIQKWRDRAGKPIKNWKKMFEAWASSKHAEAEKNQAKPHEDVTEDTYRRLREQYAAELAREKENAAT